MVSGKVVDVDKSTEVCEKLIELLNMGFIVPTLDSIEERILILDLDESIEATKLSGNRCDENFRFIRGKRNRSL